MSFTYWALEHDADGVTWVTLDRPDASANTLASFVMDELALVLDVLDEVKPRGVVFRSGKSAGFIAGADIEEFKGMDAATGRRLMQRGWDLYNRLAAVKYPTLALIRGHCMGGGLELALACRYRIVVDEPGTRLALPEVKLGIVPGWGGMLRLPKLVGPAAAMDMMLTGRTVDARRAKKMGLADECVPPRVMAQAAKMLVVSGKPPHRPPLMQRLLNGPLRNIVAKQARKSVAQKAKPEHYPAPYALIDMWQNYGGNALAVPANLPTSLDALINSPTTANLVRVFFLQERLKSFGKIDGASHANKFDAQHVHVIGAGVMGGDIAAWCALRGLRVTLQDQTMERIAPAIQRARQLFERNLREPRLVRQAMDRLLPDPAGQGVPQADVIIEAIFENIEAKQKLFIDLEARARPDAILASNTSSLRLGDISLALREPARLVGIHFFNPVAQMPLVEVVRSTITQPEIADKAAVFVRKLDKLPLPVADAPGFLVNAVLAPYLEEAMRCVDEGMAPELVDKAATDFGMPMGPIELSDTVGLDIAAMVGKQLVSGPRGTEPPRKLSELLAAKHLGKKTGQGYYAYANGKPIKAPAGEVPAGLTERLIQPMLEAAQAIVDAGIVIDADAADAGVIFGTGFAPFRGGPLHYRAGQQ
jgi:3-hydroxyacyl-CoA dehydrogenase/enoyl-CoA hydratase/3-hydroxybutyryl-CoA epimerase